MTDTKGCIRVLVAEDNADLRAAVCALIEAEHDMQLVGEAVSADEIRRVACLQDAHVVVLDLNLQGQSSVEAMRALQRERPATAAVVFSGYDAVDIAAGLSVLEPCRFVSKSGEAADLLAAIRCFGNGAAGAEP